MKWRYYEVSPRRDRLTHTVVAWRGEDGREWETKKAARDAPGEEGWELSTDDGSVCVFKQGEMMDGAKQ